MSAPFKNKKRWRQGENVTTGPRHFEDKNELLFEFAEPWSEGEGV